MELSIRPLEHGDLPFAYHLSSQAGWNQTEADWQRFRNLARDECFLAEVAGRPAGTVVTFSFGRVGWVAMLLVEQDWCGHGIGTRLLKYALDRFRSRGVETVRLDATPMGRPIYERIGFQAEYDLFRFEGRVGPKVAVTLSPLSKGSLDAVSDLDRAVTGTDRRAMLERLLATPGVTCHAIDDDGDLQGVVWTRPGRRAIQIGPALTRNAKRGTELLDWAGSLHAGEPVFLDIPTANRPATDWAEGVGLSRQRVLTRMVLGPAVHDSPTAIWASSGPEKG